jgi:hypothetical protein
MRNYFLFLLLFIGSQALAQNDYLITMNGIGALKLDMKQADVEKLLNKKFTLTNMREQEGSWMDTVKTKYKNQDITIYFERQYEDDDKFNMVLCGFKVTNPIFKTQAGINVGTDKMKLINAYEQYRINLAPDYEDDTYTTLSKTKATAFVSNDLSENGLVFYLTNKKVVALELMRYYGDDH